MADLDLGVFGGSAPSRSPTTMDIPVVPKTLAPQVPDVLRALEPAPASSPGHVGLLNAETEQQLRDTVRSAEEAMSRAAQSLGQGLRGLARQPSHPVTVDRLKIGVAFAVAVNLALVVWMVMPHGVPDPESETVVAPVAAGRAPPVQPVAPPMEQEPAPPLAVLEPEVIPVAAPVAEPTPPAQVEDKPSAVVPKPVERPAVPAPVSDESTKRAEQQERDLDAFFTPLTEQQGDTP